jgi:alkylhydroperoxidase/carboxymuconolactone decarboxylase family protein YurZ
MAPTVRPATAAEAPSPEHLEGTVVAEPGANVPLATGLQALTVRLLLLGLLAAAGAALCTWALLRRKSPPGG